MNETSMMKHEGFQEFVIEKLGTEQWIVVYQTTPYEGKENIAIHSALVPSSAIPDLLKFYSWDVTFDFGKPNISQLDSDKIVHYSRFDEEKEIEPLIIRQYFYGLFEPTLNISEEFRLFHNLHWDPDKRVFQAISLDTGEIESVVRFNEYSIEIRIQYIKQFCAFKNMHLAIYFDSIYYSDNRIESLDVGNDYIEEEGEDYHFSVYWNDLIGTRSRKSFSRFLGKKYISPMPIDETGIWPFERLKVFEEFIIEIDTNGERISFTCDPDKLSNYYGANPGSPHFLTPIFFKKDVLQKYLNFPEKYEVQDGLISCGRLWGLQIDNNHPAFIVVYLGDLGGLSNVEQNYWKSFNIPPEGSVSEVAYMRDFKNEFTDPSALDLVFKNKFKSLNEFWKTKYDWEIFLPLRPEDRFHFSSLHIPLNPSQQEFDGQILSLTKLIIDSLNEKEIAVNISITDDDKGIDKLEKYFSRSDKKEYEVHIAFLRDLQSLRSSGVAHRKGKNYAKAVKHFELDKKDTITVYQTILERAIAFLDYFTS